MDRPPSQRARSAAALLPAAGLLLLMPPIITLFAGTARPFGIPLIVLYLFGVWAALVLGAAWLAQRLREPEASGESVASAPSPAADAPPPA